MLRARSASRCYELCYEFVSSLFRVCFEVSRALLRGVTSSVLRALLRVCFESVSKLFEVLRALVRGATSSVSRCYELGYEFVSSLFRGVTSSVTRAPRGSPPTKKTPYRPDAKPNHFWYFCNPVSEIESTWIGDRLSTSTARHARTHLTFHTVNNNMIFLYARLLVFNPCGAQGFDRARLERKGTWLTLAWCPDHTINDHTINEFLISRANKRITLRSFGFKAETCTETLWTVGWSRTAARSMMAFAVEPFLI